MNLDGDDELSDLGASLEASATVAVRSANAARRRQLGLGRTFAAVRLAPGGLHTKGRGDSHWHGIGEKMRARLALCGAQSRAESHRQGHQKN
jgi:hypothetical protein